MWPTGPMARPLKITLQFIVKSAALHAHIWQMSILHWIFCNCFFQNESTFIFSQQHQNLTWSLISPLNLIWWERRLEIAFEACGHPHPGSAHHKIVASCKFWSPSSSTCWQVTIAHIRPIWAHFGYLCTFWCRCTFTDLNIMRWCTTLTNMRYATII